MDRMYVKLSYFEFQYHSECGWRGPIHNYAYLLDYNPLEP